MTSTGSLNYFTPTLRQLRNDGALGQYMGTLMLRRTGCKVDSKSNRTARYSTLFNNWDVHFVSNTDLSFQLLPQQRLESLAVFSEFFDTLVEFVKRHGVLEKFPPEFGLIINVSDLGDWSGRSS